MSYTINFELGKPNKHKEKKVYIKVYSEGKKLPREDTGVRIKGTIRAASQEVKNIINKKRLEVEKKILASLQYSGKVMLPKQSMETIKGYWEVKKKKIVRAESRFKAIGSALNHIEDYPLREFNKGLLEQIHLDFTKVRIKKDEKAVPLEQNTIWGYMQRIQTVLNLAIEDKMMAKEQIEGFEWPEYSQKVPVFLTEVEIEAFQTTLEGIAAMGHRIAGHYFLLACYAGYRISDAKRFNPDEFINGDMINLRADKNGRIVSIPIHSRLRRILDFVIEHPCHLEEPTIRKYVKDIAGLAGIRKHVKFHTARHSFAMLLTKNGFHVEEVAELIGDDIRTAKIYAKLWNENLNKKILEKLG